MIPPATFSFFCIFITTFGGCYSLVPPEYKDKTVTVTDRVFFDISIAGYDAGRIVLGLFGDFTPWTVQNFIALSTMKYNKGYMGVPFHRIMKDFMIQGGDYKFANGSGEDSIYNAHRAGLFDDEDMSLNHYTGWLAMANRGPDTNSCQFYICLDNTFWLDGHHTVFGVVLDGMDVVNRIGNLATRDGYKPYWAVVVRNCSTLPTERFDIIKEAVGEYGIPKEKRFLQLDVQVEKAVQNLYDKANTISEKFDELTQNSYNMSKLLQNMQTKLDEMIAETKQYGDNLQENGEVQNQEENNQEQDNQEQDNQEQDNQEQDNQEQESQEQDNQEQDNQEQESQEQDNQEQDNQGQDNQEQDNQGQDNQGQDNQGQDNQGEKADGNAEEGQEANADNVDQEDTAGNNE